MAVTYEQLQNTTRGQTYSDPELNMAAKEFWSNRDFGDNFREIQRNLDRFSNWNNPTKPQDYQAALEQRNLGLQNLDSLKSYYLSKGIDITSFPQYKSALSGFGVTPETGITSQQRAAGVSIAPVDKATADLVSSNINTGTQQQDFTSPTISVTRDGATVQIKNDPATIKIYTDAGYQLSTGSTQNVNNVNTNNVNNATTTTQPNLQLPNGQIISSSDPNYSSYASQSGVTPITTDTTTTGTTSTGIQSTGNAQLDEMLGQVKSYLDQITKSGQQVNPNIELTPAEVQSFLDQAANEISPYYASQFNAIKEDLSASLKSMQKQYDLDKQTAEAKLKSELGTYRESAAGAGTAFSGQRQMDESNYVSGANRQFESGALSAAEKARELLSGTEQKIGTRNISDLTGYGSFSVPTATSAGAGGINVNRSLSTYTSPGNVIGSLEREQTTAKKTRQSQLEEAARKTRALNFYS